jgi:hypothetical protein
MPNTNTGPRVFTVPADLSPSRAGQALHKRGTVGIADTTITTAFSGIPSNSVAVTVQVETVDAANVTYVTFDDGVSTPSATLGFVVPVAPGTMRIPFRKGLISGTGIHFIAVGGTAHIQGYFEVE